jgi:hypothetical protein
MTKRSRVDDVSPGVAPCVRGVLIEDNVPALGVWRIVQRCFRWEDGAFETLLYEGLRSVKLEETIA